MNIYILSILSLMYKNRGQTESLPPAISIKRTRPYDKTHQEAVDIGLLSLLQTSECHK